MLPVGLGFESHLSQWSFTRKLYKQAFAYETLQVIEENLFYITISKYTMEDWLELILFLITRTS